MHTERKVDPWRMVGTKTRERRTSGDKLRCCILLGVQGHGHIEGNRLKRIAVLLLETTTTTAVVVLHKLLIM